VKWVDLYSAYDAGHSIDLHVGGDNPKVEGGVQGSSSPYKM